ncbi:hypothetical protein IFT90_04230 [Frigoribacterium sp. CFBP 8766]|nr:hypothetical protein [Frigoribacterium sp. CFBP 8766]MBD8583763.1 hypothetical protein [Frigoribacterium sp. CFBP 8766]
MSVTAIAIAIAIAIDVRSLLHGRSSSEIAHRGGPSRGGGADSGVMVEA